MVSLSLQELIRPISSDLEAFDRKLNQYLSADSALINAVIEHIMASRGKRLRPAMLFLTARSGGYHSPRLVEAALAIELIHTATLLHDDVVDEADFRRGRLTVNHQWNNLVSVLMGDFLFSRAFVVMLKTGSSEVIRSINAATERVSFGELRQIEKAPIMIWAKRITSRSFRIRPLPCLPPRPKPGRYSKKPPPGNEANTGFRRERRIAFQIADDLLDFVGNSDKTGKNTGADLIQGKVTLPLIHSLARSSKKVRAEITSIMSNGINRRGLTGSSGSSPSRAASIMPMAWPGSTPSGRGAFRRDEEQSLPPDARGIDQIYRVPGKLNARRRIVTHPSTASHYQLDEPTEGIITLGL